MIILYFVISLLTATAAPVCFAVLFTEPGVPKELMAAKL